MDEWTAFLAGFLLPEQRRSLSYTCRELSRPERRSAPDESDLALGPLYEVRDRLLRIAERNAERATAVEHTE